MSSSPIRRRRALALAGAMLSLIIMAGCTGQQKVPGDYAGAKEDFLQGCTDTAVNDNENGAEPQIAAPDVYCGCVFDALSDPNSGVPWEEFKSINSDLSDNGGTLPKSYIETSKDCDPKATS